MLLENQPYPADVRVRSEAETLARHEWEVTVIAPRAPGERRRDTIRGVRVTRFGLPPERPGPGGLLLEYAVANLQLHLRGALELLRGARVVHLHNPPDTLFGLAWLARATGARVVFDHHDLAPELYEAKFGSRPRALVSLLRVLEQRSLQAATHVLAANESHRAVALERARLSPGAVTVVRNGPPAADLRAPAGNGGSLSEPTLVFVGSMAEQDGVVELPEILRELEARHGVRGRLLAVGEGPSRAALAERCRELGLEGRVELPGRLPHDEVPARLAEADICVDPAPCSALNHRSTMVKIAEYLAAARPVVAYRLRETEHTAGDAAAFAECGDRGAFVDAIARLAGDGAERERLAKLGRLRADELTWERSEQALLNVYSRL